MSRETVSTVFQLVRREGYHTAVARDVCWKKSGDIACYDLDAYPQNHRDAQETLPHYRPTCSIMLAIWTEVRIRSARAPRSRASVDRAGRPPGGSHNDGGRCESFCPDTHPTASYRPNTIAGVRCENSLLCQQTHLIGYSQISFV